MAEGDDDALVEAMSKNTDALERLLETTQDLFILQCLDAICLCAARSRLQYVVYL